MPATGALERFRRRGVFASLRRIIDRLLWRVEEYRLGVQTSGDIPADQLGHSEQQYGYQPIDPRSLRNALDFLRPNSADVFVDMGCGLGRAVLVASRYPFAKVLGVEYSKPLYVAAHRNANRASKRLARQIQIIHADATTWEFPDDVTVVFLFNPFQGAMLEKMLANLRRSLDRRPRELHVIYSLPKTDQDQMADCHWLKPEQTIPTENPEWERLTVYRASLL